MYKTNRQNHDFQIVYFLAGSCHTPDAAWSLLQDLREDRKLALDTNRANDLRTRAKKLRAENRAKSADPAEALEGEADLLEIELTAELGRKNVRAAEAELATIERCIAAIAPMRRFANLPDEEAHEAAQTEEWRLRLLYQAQNYMLTQGTLPADHLATMRMHPQFEKDMLPSLDKISAQIASARSSGKLANVPLLIEKPAFSMPALLESK